MDLPGDGAGPAVPTEDLRAENRFLTDQGKTPSCSCHTLCLYHALLPPQNTLNKIEILYFDG